MSDSTDTAAAPPVVGRGDFERAVAELRVREKAHMRAGDALAAARRRLPMVEVDATADLIGPNGPVSVLEVFQGRRQLLGYYFMWYDGRPAPGQCEGCTYFTSQVRELSYLHSRDTTFAVLCQGPYEASVRYRDFMDWDMPWYSAQPSLDTLLTGRQIGMFHLISYLRLGNRVFETYWTNGRGVEAMDNTYGLLELTAYGRQEPWEDSPADWPRAVKAGDRAWSTDGRPTAQWARVRAGRSDDLGAVRD